MKAFYYIVAGHGFSVLAADGVELSGPLAHYAPFAVPADDASCGRPVFSLKVVPTLERPEGLTEEFNQDDDGSQIRLSRTVDGASWFEFSLWGQLSSSMLAAADFKTATLSLSSHSDFGLNNALMVMYAMSTARLGTALFHAAVIGNAGNGYLFLGKSGTGKSTHARLWLNNIPGTELMNDDNPAVRVKPDGTAVVYGTPWSGKTPCYRNVSAPVAGIVLLSQAPYNRIVRLKGIGAYAAVVPSISGKRWDSVIADGLHDTENYLATNIPVWHLDCLPDSNAAHLCKDTIAL